MKCAVLGIILKNLILNIMQGISLNWSGIPAQNSVLEKRKQTDLEEKPPISLPALNLKETSSMSTTKTS